MTISFHQNIFKVLWLMLISTCIISSHLEAIPRYRNRHHQRKMIHYTLVDVGVSGLPADSLGKYTLPFSQAPSINNDGQVIYNDKKGGVLWDPIKGKMRLGFEEIFARFHDIANDGTILASLADVTGYQSWWLWPERCHRRINPMVIPAEAPEDSSVYFRTISDNGIVGGFVKHNDNSIWQTQAVVWPPSNKLTYLCPGITWDVSKNGYAVANTLHSQDNSPYLWHHKGGYLVLDDQPKLHKPKAKIRYVDMLLTEHDAVYGTFFYENASSILYGFYWDPCQEIFHMLDLGNMRINSLNACETMVGSSYGRAVVRERDQSPTYLDRVVDVQGKSWSLLEATDINDLGQIVGYGMVDGQTHIFLLNPVENKVLKIYHK